MHVHLGPTRILWAHQANDIPIGIGGVIAPRSYAARSPWIDLAASKTGFTQESSRSSRRVKLTGLVHEMTAAGLVEDLEAMRWPLVAMLWQFESSGQIGGRVFEGCEFSLPPPAPGDFGLLLVIDASDWHDLVMM